MSAPERKTRPDAVLQNLPEARQDEIGSWMLPGKGNKSFAKIQKILAGDGIQVSQQALSKFYSWWFVRRQYRQMQDTTETLVELRKEEQPDLTDEELFRYGQRVFGTLAIKDQSPKVWAVIQKLRQKETDLKFQQEKFKEAIKGDIERALDALFEEIKGNKAALELFERFKAVVKGATK